MAMYQPPKPKSIQRVGAITASLTMGMQSLVNSLTTHGEYATMYPEISSNVASPTAGEIPRPSGPVKALIDGGAVSFKSMEEKFAALLEAWEDHNAGRSVTNYDHPAYLQIVGMGDWVVPRLLEKLEEGDGDWIYAIKLITGHEEETAAMVGDGDQVIAAWLEWGKTYGKIGGTR